MTRSAVWLVKRLSTLLDIGFTEAEAASRLRQGAPPELLPTVSRLEEELKRGTGLGQAARSCGLELIRGEVDAPSLKQAAELAEGAAARRRRLAVAMAYPKLVVSTLVLLLVVLKFGGVWESVDTSLGGVASLPARLQALVSHPLFLALAFAGGAYCWWLLSSPRAEHLRCRLPVIGEWIRYEHATTWLVWLGFSLRCGQPLPLAAEAAAAALPEGWVKASCLRAADSVARGQGLARSLEQDRSLPEMVVWLIGRAESAGLPPDQLERITALSSRQLEDSFTMGLEFLEPFLILVLGGAAGALVALLLSPLLSMMEALSY